MLIIVIVCHVIVKLPLIGEIDRRNCARCHRSIDVDCPITGQRECGETEVLAEIGFLRGKRDH
jgi:hypothetical protein